jgi:inosine-uridine nucleoside N-ribohydrolase
MLLGWPDVEVVGITTNLDVNGRRAGAAAHYLRLAGRQDIPVEAGAGTSLTTLDVYFDTSADPRYWPEPIQPRRGTPGRALDLLTQSVERGATIIAIGAYTNLAMLEVTRPGTLTRVPVVAMGGWLRPPAKGLPPWGPDMDWNVQCDIRAAEILAAKAGHLSLVTLPAALNVHLRAAHLPRLRAAGPVGELLARQSEAHAADNRMDILARSHPGLPDDLINFHYDPLAGAVAAAWPGATLKELRLGTVTEDGVLRFEERPDGRPVRVVLDADGDGFAEMWLCAIENIHRANRRPGL